MEYADARSEGSYHPPKVAEENVVPLPVPQPSLTAADQLCPPSDQENIPPRAVTPPPLNILVPIITGGKGVITQWVHGEFIVSFETIRLVNTHQVCVECF